MAIKLFPNAKIYTLNEDDKANPHKSAYENYTGVVFDTDRNEFKVVTGRFRDKKDMYNKMTKEDKYLRRAYESKIWDWIQDNAKTPIDGYLMLSTAVSKWVNNNVLSKYYVKLLHDLPYINREGRKGDPQTMGIKASFESVEETEEDKMLNEAIMNEAEKNLETELEDALKRDIEKGLMSKHNVTIYPVNSENKIDKKPLLVYPNTFLYNDLYNLAYAKQFDKLKTPKDQEKAQKARIFNSQLIYNLVKEIKKYPTEDDARAGRLNTKYAYPNEKVAFVIDDKMNDPIILTKQDIMQFFRSLDDNRIGEDQHIEWLPLDMHREKTAIQNASTGVSAGIYNPSVQSRVSIATGAAIPLSSEAKIKIKKLKDLENYLVNLTYEQLPNAVYPTYKFDLETGIENAEPIFDLKNGKKIFDPNNGDIVKQRQAKVNAINNEIQEIKNSDRLKQAKNNPLTQFQNAEEKFFNLNKPIKIGNPLHNSAYYTNFIDDISNKNIFKKQLKKAYTSAMYNKDYKIAKLIKDLYTKEPITYTKTEQKAAEQLVKKWNAMNIPEEQEHNKKRHEEIINDLAKKTNIDLNLLKKAGHEVLKDKADELKKLKPEFFTGEDRYADPVNAAIDYFDKNHNHDNEFITALNKKYTELQKEQNVQEESYVNGGANSLMQQTDNIAKAEQKYCLSNINEEKTHSELNQELFNGEELKEDIRQALIKIADEFKEKLKLPFEPVDIYFTGSEANYNYNEYSDIDLHLVYDFEQAGVCAEILNKYLQSAKRVFNDEHDITIKNIPVEVGAENTAEPLTTSGVYSLISNNWVIKPEYSNTEIEEPEQATLDELKNQIEDAISEDNQSKIEGMIKTVWDMRKEGLKNEGEFGPANTLFKTLRNEGILARLKDAYYAAESRDLSLESIMKEDFFKGRDEIFTIEDDLINKSEQEIYDGLMSHYDGNSNEALAKLEDVIKTCDDGYKDKLKDVVKKIKEESTFENKCNIIIEKSLSDLTKDDFHKSSYVSKLKDVAEIDEMLAFVINDINSMYKDKFMPFRYVDKAGNKKQFILAGIEKGDNPENVLIRDASMTYDPDRKQFFKNYGKDFKPMPLSQFLEILNNGLNDSWKNALDKRLNMNLGDFYKFASEKKEDIEQAYKNWYLNYKDEYELDRYPFNTRQTIYKRIMKKHERPDLVLNDYKKIDDWRKDINKEEESLEEASYSKDDFYVISDKQEGRYIKSILEKLNILPEFIRVPFAITTGSTQASSRSKRKNLGISGDTKYYTIYGFSKETDENGNPKDFLVRNTSETGAPLGRQPQIVPFNTIFLAIHDPKNDIDSVIDRANEQWFDYEGNKAFTGRTWEGEFIDLQPEEIRAVLDIVEQHLKNENEMYKFIHNTKGELNPKYYSHLVDIYEDNPSDFRILRALKMLDKDVAPCIRQWKTKKGTTYKIWLPFKDGQSNPPIHASKSPTDEILKP